ncbi:MAG: hypothetical protein ABIO46_02590, partial [Chitinophagales bacterium]
LLIEREKFYRQNESLRKKAWYIVNKQCDKKLLPGKKLFFEKLRIEIIEAKNSKQIYDVTPKRLKRIKSK